MIFRSYQLTLPKMAWSISAVNDSVITKDDIPGASLAGLNPLLKNEQGETKCSCFRNKAKGQELLQQTWSF